MSVKAKILNLLCSLAFVLVIGTVAFADTIHLKDGSLIKGRIVSFVGGNFVVEIGDGSRRRQLTFSASEIESIKFDTPSMPAQITQSTNRTASYTEPAPKPAPPKPIIETPVTTTDPQPEETEPVQPSYPQPQQPKAGEKMKPIEWTVKVAANNASNGWTNSGWVVKRGQRIRIEGDGTVSLGHGQTSPPAGLSSLEDNTKLMKSVPTGALIAVVGDDNNDFIYVGAQREFTATRDGALFLGVNEGNLDDNSGSYSVKIQIIPDGAE
jgi:hypothetical protein